MADVVIAGAAGRMGCRLVALVQEEKDLRLVAALEAPGHPALLQDAGDVAVQLQPTRRSCARLPCSTARLSMFSGRLCCTTTPDEL